MFSANISGKIKRVLFDNEKDAEKAFVKVVVECKKQFVKKGDLPYTYPVVAIFGHDAAYFRDYAGAGHYVEFTGCDLDSYRGEDGDEDEKLSFKSGKIGLLPKDLSDQLDIVDEEAAKKKKKKTGSSRDDDRKSSSGKSRSERRKARDEDDDDDDDDSDDEDEAPRRKKKPDVKEEKKRSSEKDKKKSSGKDDKKSNKKSRDDDDDFDDDDDDFYDDDED